MKILKSSEMKWCDEKTIKELGISSLVLMENASRSMVEVLIGKNILEGGKKVIVVAGKGNNGGDGLAVARILYLLGLDVRYYLVYGEVRSKDAKTQLKILNELGVKEEKKIANISKYDIVVDAIYGTGFKPPPDEEGAYIIRYINKCGGMVISVDIPSGLSADSCEIFEPSVRADITVTFQFPKVCHAVYPALKRCGEVFVMDISIPPFYAEDINREMILPWDLEIAEREPDVYKNRLGHVLIIGGSEGKTGAVVMSAKSATETGSGLVTVGVPEDLNPVFENKLTEEMSLPLPERKFISSSALDYLEDMLPKFSAIALGMGMDVYREGYDFIKGLLSIYKNPILLDADALNNIYKYGTPSLFSETEATLVITPHVGEMARLTGLESVYISNNLVDVACEYAEKWKCYIVLKSATTVIATPEGKAFISSWGTPAMAKGGSGDVLSGILVSLLGRGMNTESALKLGVILHAFAGRYAEKLKHRESVRATDIITGISYAYNNIEKLLENKSSVSTYPIIFMQSCCTC